MCSLIPRLHGEEPGYEATNAIKHNRPRPKPAARPTRPPGAAPCRPSPAYPSRPGNRRCRKAHSAERPRPGGKAAVWRRKSERATGCVALSSLRSRIAPIGELAPAAGIEPTFSVLETDALPLHHAGASAHCSKAAAGTQYPICGFQRLFPFYDAISPIRHPGIPSRHSGIPSRHSGASRNPSCPKQPAPG